MNRKKIIVFMVLISLLVLGCGCGSQSQEQSDQIGVSVSEEKKVSTSVEKSVNEESEGENINRKSDKDPLLVAADDMTAFQNIKGCAVIFDEAKNRYTLYNEEACKKQVSP